VGDVDPQAIARSIWARSSRKHLGVVGVLPQVFEGAREAALARLQRRCVGDRPPPVALVLGVEGEVDTDVVARHRHARRRDAHGAGTMIDAHVAAPSRRARNTPTLAA
jgi:hypothetical protein